MRSIKYTVTCLFILIFLGACDSSVFLLPGGPGPSFQVTTVVSGDSLGNGDFIPLTVNTARLRVLPDKILVALLDSEKELVKEYVFVGESLNLATLPDIELNDLPLDEGLYSIVVELFQDDESLGVHDSWFFYTDKSIDLAHITFNPHSVVVGELIEVLLRLQGQEEGRSPYIQFRVGNEVVYQGVVLENTLQFEFQAPEESGGHNLSLDIYPWFDDRLITDEKTSDKSSEKALSNRYNFELLVLSEHPPSEDSNEHRIRAEKRVTITENLLYYNEELLRFAVLIEEVPNLSSVFFEVGDGEFMLSLSREGPSLGFTIYRGDETYVQEIKIPGARELRQLRVEFLEGNAHFTMLIFQKDRFLHGGVFSYHSVPNPAPNTGNTVIASGSSTTSKTRGLRTTQPLGEIVIRPLPDQPESLYRKILEQEHGNFVLYAEGFEFESSVEGLEYSADVSVEQGYLLIPPGAWVQFPPFALDEYRVQVTTSFHPDDALDSTNIGLLQHNGAELQEVFRLSADGKRAVELRSKESIYVKGLKLGAVVDFVLHRQNDLITLDIQDNTMVFPVNEDGAFVLNLNQNQDSKIYMRLDSLSATNEADEFVDRVLNSLP